MRLRLLALLLVAGASGTVVGLADSATAGKAEPAEGTVVVLSGGNVDPALHARIVAGD